MSDNVDYLKQLLFSDLEGTFPFESKTCQLKYGQIRYVDEGAGDPVLLLHGNPTWSYLYRNIIPGLAPENRVIAPDFPGFGRSDKPIGGDYSLAGQIYNLTNFVQTLALDKITLVVHDWGGPIGLGFAIKHLEKIKNLIILNTWAFSSPEGTELPALLEAIKKPKLGERLVLEQNVMVEQGIPGGIFAKDLITPLLLDAYRAPFYDEDFRKSILMLVREIPKGLTDGAANLIKSIQSGLRLLKVPVLIIWGEKDPVFPVDLVKMWRMYFPRAEIHLEPDASHFLQEDIPERIVKHISHFLKKNP